MNNDPRILFVHVPKSAGISLFKSLAQIIGPSRTLRFADGSEANKEKYLSMPDEEVRKYYLLSGHFPLPFFLKKAVHDYKIITVLRNPIDRELSAFFYIKTSEKHPRHQQIKNMNLYQYLAQRERQGVKNSQCWHVCGTTSFQKAIEAINEQYFLAAPIDHLKLFCEILAKKLCFPSIDLKHENKTSFRLNPEEIHPALLKRFEAMTQGDIKLYTYVKEKFEREYLNKI